MGKRFYHRRENEPRKFISLGGNPEKNGDHQETKQKPRIPKNSRKKRSPSKTQNNAETIWSAITKNNFRVVKIKQKKPRRNCGNRRRAHAKSKPYRRQILANITRRRRGRTGSPERRSTTNRTKHSRHRRRQRDNAGRQSADRRPQRIPYRRQGSPLPPNKPHSGKTYRNQKDDRREHKESRNQLHARLKDSYFKNGYWSGSDKSKSQHEERRKRHRSRSEGYRPVSELPCPHQLTKKIIWNSTFRSIRDNRMLSEAKKIFRWPEMRKDIEQKVEDCTACSATGKNLKHQIPKNQYGNLEKLSEPGQELQIDFTWKSHNKNLNREPQNLMAIDRLNKWPTAKRFKLSELKEVISFLSNQFNLYGFP